MARRLALLWAIGASLRLTVLSVPPLLPAMHASLPLDETTVGLLTGLPILLFAVGAVPGSLLISRLGTRRTVLSGLAAVALAGAARGAGPSLAVLFAATLVMGAGIAVAQPAMPALIGEWAPDRVRRAAALYGNGLLVGEIVAAALTAPLLLALFGGWSAALAAWSLPVLVVAALLSFEPGDGAAAASRWFPEWRDPRVWRLGLLLGMDQIAFWGTNAFIPDYLHAIGRGDLVPLALGTLNAAQLPASIAVAAVPAFFAGRRWPLYGSGVALLVSGVGLATTSGPWALLWCAAIGIASGLVFVLVLALPPLLASSGDVHRLSAGMFTISYPWAFFGPLAGGALWDATRLPAAAFVPLVVAGAVMAWLARLVPAPRDRDA